jgi:hypothetical protein
MRKVREGKLVQGQDEKIAYSITTTPWGSSPADVAVSIYRVTAGAYEDVSDDCLEAGSPQVVGDKITTPRVIGLTPGELYRLEIRFTAGGQVFEPYIEIEAER